MLNCLFVTNNCLLFYIVSVIKLQISFAGNSISPKIFNLLFKLIKCYLTEVKWSVHFFSPIAVSVAGTFMLVLWAGRCGLPGLGLTLASNPDPGQSATGGPTQQTQHNTTQNSTTQHNNTWEHTMRNK